MYRRVFEYQVGGLCTRKVEGIVEGCKIAQTRGGEEQEKSDLTDASRTDPHGMHRGSSSVNHSCCVARCLGCGARVKSNQHVNSIETEKDGGS